MNELAMQAIDLLKKAIDSGQLKDTLIGKEIEEFLSSTSIQVTGGNILLNYPIAVQLGDEVFFADQGQVFTDEQHVQWVKFIAKNGYRRGEEHIIRTDRVIIVRRGQHDVA
jgi:hypothetical protein